MAAGIRTRLTAAFLGVAVAPLLLVAWILIVQSYRARTQEAILLQREMAAHLAVRVSSFFRELEVTAQSLIRVEDLLEMSPDRRRLVLSVFHSRQSAIDDLMLLDAGGRVLSYASRLKIRPDQPSGPPESLGPLLDRGSRAEIRYGPVRIDAASGEPLMLMAVPILALQTGRAKGMLVADVRLKEFWDLVASVRPGQEGTSYIVDADDRVVAHSDPSVVLRGTRSEPPRADGVQPGLAGEESVVVSRPVSLGGREFRVCVEAPVSEALSQARDAVRVMAIVVVVVLLAACGTGFHLARRIVRPIESIAASARAINAGDLSRRVSVEGRDELAVLAEAFNGMASQVESLIDGLERRVAERTARLASANRELESFSYSVSHDLRAPLRHIDGYVGLMTSRYRGELSEQGVHYLDAIAGAARRMGELVDGLLQFSRTGRAELRRETVDMDRLVREVVLALQESCAGRTVEWVVGELQPVPGDAVLLRQVWTNLLANAVKFTRTRETARIEVGSRVDGGEVVFAVADNGVGFDMRYVDKLFGVFQRLHRQEEFEGTGIGLALVQRIVDRHGGRVWAEAAQGEGARFCFALPALEPGAAVRLRSA